MRQLRALIVVAAVVLAGQAAARRAAPTPTTYKVHRGDTLSRIAHRFHTTVANLVAANSLANPNRIWGGQVLRLTMPPPPKPTPAAATKGAPASGVFTEPPLNDTKVVLGGGGATYVVRSGDTLAAIASRLHTSVADLLNRNHIKATSILHIGQVLAVAGATTWVCPVKGETHFDYHDDWGAWRAGGKRHMGNDMFAARGTPVLAPVAGTLEFRTGSIGGNAFYVHGVDGVTYYGAHLDHYTAKPGPIAQGAQIGVVGNTGDAAGGATHLHFEVHPNGVAVDPFPTLTRWCW